METTGAGLMTAPVDGAATVPQTTAPLTQHGGPERAVSVSPQVAADTLCSLTPWCRCVALACVFRCTLLNVRVGRDALNIVLYRSMKRLVTEGQ